MKWLGFAKLGVAAGTILAMIVLSSGCGDGVVFSRRERKERHKRIFENDMKQLADDWDAFWLNDAPSRMTPWRVR